MVYDGGPPSPEMPHDVPQLELPPSPTRRKVLAGGTNWMQMLRPPKPPKPVVSLVYRAGTWAGVAIKLRLPSCYPCHASACIKLANEPSQVQ